MPAPARVTGIVPGLLYQYNVTWYYTCLIGFPSLFGLFDWFSWATNDVSVSWSFSLLRIIMSLGFYWKNRAIKRYQYSFYYLAHKWMTRPYRKYIRAVQPKVSAQFAIKNRWPVHTFTVLPKCTVVHRWPVHTFHFALLIHSIAGALSSNR